MAGYPRSREEASAQLQKCVNHLKGRFNEAVEAAAHLVDEEGKVILDEVDLSNDCFFAGKSRRAKCDTLEGLGRSLHGVEDFYAHSNWADREDASKPIGIENPPGLARTDLFPYFDFRTEAKASGTSNGTSLAEGIPRALATGCFSLAFGCEDRVEHEFLAKDKGIINLDGTFGGSQEDPRSKAAEGNFEAAVKLAVQDAKRQWKYFGEELVAKYGKQRGETMICAVVKDNPGKDCGVETVASGAERRTWSKVVVAVSLAIVWLL